MVLVEYHDPDGLFPALKPHLQARLPLKTLHWKSSSRPLRSIATLEIDFVASVATQATRLDSDHTRRNATDGGNRPSDAPARDSASILGVRSNQKRVQRHQIPGLRDSPFLKIYLLKCDDKETYKATARKTVREWLRENASQSPSTTGQDAHDASEWLIVHVVAPNTPAAVESRVSRSSGSDFEPPTPKSASATKWTGRKSSTIVEKLKADFNHSSKHAPDRIAQVILSKDDANQTSEGRPPTSDAFAAYDEAAVAWNDVVAKFKTLILMSFSTRVGQYEDDVKQRDAQRTLPGWNFCTFFVLKEGLGRAFESVGLVEDALTIYDELSAGLDTVIEELELDKTGSRTNSFLPASPDLKAIFSDTGEQRESATQALSLPKPIDEAAKPYRDLIVSNNISVFDMKCYIFARQLSILLRLASPGAGLSSPKDSTDTEKANVSPRSEDVRVTGEIEDALSLASLCERATRFIATMSRLLHHELESQYENPSNERASLSRTNSVEHSQTELSDISDDLYKLKIEAAIWSWTFATARQILIQTASPSFPAPPSSSFTSTSPRSDLFPSRRTSLPASVLGKAPVSPEAVYEEGAMSIVHELKSFQPIKNNELSNAASMRAELYMLQRRVLEKAARSCDLHLRNAQGASGEAKSDDEEEGAEPEHKQPNDSIRWILDTQLTEALSTENSFQAFHQTLSDHASWAYLISNRPKAAQRLAADLAVVKYSSGDYAKAAGYFNRLSMGYGLSNWELVETSMLSMHARCLKMLNRKDEHMRIVMLLLARSLAEPKVVQVGSMASPRRIDAECLFKDTVAFSAELPYDYVVPLDDFMRISRVDNSITLLDDQDGFSISIELSQKLVAVMQIDRVRARFVDAEDGSLREIWLENNQMLRIDATSQRIWLKTNVSTFGSYIVDKISVHAGKIAFVREALTRSEPTTPLGRPSLLAGSSIWAAKRAAVLCFPRRSALLATAKAVPYSHIGKRKSMQVRIESGANQVLAASLQVKAKYAGLRVFHSEASAMTSTEALEVSSTGQIRVGRLQPDSHFTVAIPWEVEKPATEIAVRIEVLYTTPQGDFVFVASQTIDVDLLIDVTVQDLFKRKALMSQFLFKPLNKGPVHILAARLDSSKLFEASQVGKMPGPLTASAHDPVCLIYRIKRRVTDVPGDDEERRLGSKLCLYVTYRSVHQDALEQSRDQFTKEVEASPFTELTRLLERTFTSNMLRVLQRPMLEEASVTGCLQMTPFSQFGWATAIEGIGEEQRADLGEWLELWHQRNDKMRLQGLEDTEYGAKLEANELTVDFEVPRLRYLHTATVRLSQQRSGDSTHVPIIGAGDAVLIEIRISHTRRWDHQKADASKGTTEFVLEVVADATAWLVAGQKRATFSADEDETVSFSLHLVPVKAGRCLLPTVDVQLASPAADKAEEVAVCETDCTTACECVMVLEQSQSTTVGVGQGMELRPGMTLLDSEAIGASAG